jgi:hypothetical protein
MQHQGFVDNTAAPYVMPWKVLQKTSFCDLEGLAAVASLRW